MKVLSEKMTPENKKRIIEKTKLSIFALVRNIREQRYQGVQVDKQYEMLYTYYKKICSEFFD